MNDKLSLPAVQISRRGEERIESGHLWIYEADVAGRGGAKGGDTVLVVTQRGRPVGTAHYSDSSKITLRLLSRHTEAADRAFYLRRLQAAAAHRARVVENSDAYRLVHAEGDLLPGLIVDVYANCVVAQFLTQGMERVRGEIVACLEELLRPVCIVARNDVPSRKHEKLPETTETLLGDALERVRVRMNGLTLLADVVHGQKTGVYLDQRENYVAAARWAHGRALDCFSSTGGFALQVAAKCDSVEAVESSPVALEAARANAAENNIANVSFREADVFEYLSGCVQARRKFQTIVLDPPAFAKSKPAVEGALRAYREINLKALKLLESGGVLVTCSCSYHISEAALLETLAQAALEAGKTLRMLERRSQAQDHPVLLTVPETLYLKCLIVEVL
ncbi:MAG: class I SAM-dependent rRNA methyltransferase [Bryobacteraceae bacterium]